jgi:hypothetical protein
LDRHPCALLRVERQLRDETRPSPMSALGGKRTLTHPSATSIFAPMQTALLSFALLLAEAPASSKAPSIPANPPFRLLTPNWHPLTGSQIRAAVSGHHLRIDENYKVAPGLKPKAIFAGGCPPPETFYADGRWTTFFCDRAGTGFEGRWSVEPFRGGEHLCVEAPDFPKSCRFVWGSRSPSRLFMPTTVSSWATGKQEYDWDQAFNRYVLVPIDAAK